MGASIVDRMAVRQYEMVRLGCQVDASGVLTTFADLRLRNENGQIRGTDNREVVWTKEEEAIILAKVEELLTAYETETGWTKFDPATSPVTPVP